MGLLSKLKQKIGDDDSDPPGAFGVDEDSNTPIMGAEVNKPSAKPPATDAANVPLTNAPQSAGAASVEVDKFCPARVGEALCNGRYTVKGQLGTGRYSAVWLVEDTSCGQYYAVKILSTDFYNGKWQIFELEVMERIRDVSSRSMHPGKDHVAQMKDNFEIAGTSGRHVCMVFELLGGSIAEQATSSQIQRLPSKVVKSITWQLLEALDFIHRECGIIHTDISPSNICIELPDPLAAIAATGANTAGKIELTTPSLVQTEDIRIRLNDFGIACFTDRHLTDDIEPPLLRAPEVTLGAPWDSSVDIFNVGALSLQFLTGQLPFPSRRRKQSASGPAESDRLVQLIGSFGAEPDVVLDNADRAEEFARDGVDLKRGPTRKDRVALEKFVGEYMTGSDRGERVTGAEVHSVCDLLRRMLATDPRLREPARVLLKHPWLNDQWVR